MKVSFILPFSGHQPVGGFKVVYEYANGFAARGHEVSVFHAPYLRREEKSPWRLLRQSAVFLTKSLGLAGGYRPDPWFRTNPSVKLKWIPTLHHRFVSTADAVIATAWETAEWVARYPLDRGKKFYLIQHLESTFPGAEPDRVMTTWRLPFHKLVIARWLKDIAADLGEDATYIPNGLNFSSFNLDNPIERRDPQRLIMLNHHLAWKGSREGVAAILMAKKEEPGLKATLFGLPARPFDLPEWISYEQNPSQRRLRQLYNEAAIFIGPSWAEGWPLPPAEAAQCGAALCLTEIGGHLEYGKEGETVLFSPPRVPDAMASNIMRLVKDNPLRIRLGQQAHEFVMQFTWERAVTAFERLLTEAGC